MRFVLILSVILHVAQAEPRLRLPDQPVSIRTNPEPFVVDDYEGVIRWGPQRIRFTAPGGSITWQVWENETYIAIITSAMQLIAQKALGNRRCNNYFAAMPRGRTFDQIWQSAGRDRIHISFSPGSSGMWRAATYGTSLPFDWTITENTVVLGPASVASAMVHEASRTNGSGADVKTAYSAEVACGMQQFIINRPVMEKLGWRYTIE
jgi:hypothetical protein